MGSPRSTARRRLASLIAALALAAAILPAVPFVGHARAATKIEVQPPEAPPPPLSDSERQQVPANDQPAGELDPPIAEPPTFSSAEELEVVATDVLFVEVLVHPSIGTIGDRAHS